MRVDAVVALWSHLSEPDQQAITRLVGSAAAGRIPRGPGGWVSANDIARDTGLDVRSIRRRLEKWRAAHPGPANWIVTTPANRPEKPNYAYAVDAIADEIVDLARCCGPRSGPCKIFPAAKIH